MSQAGNDKSHRAHGKVNRVIGSVVDADFPLDEVPEIHSALEVGRDLEGHSSVILCEVVQRVGASTIRALAMEPTHGVSKGASVWSSGRPITVPVGKEALGHVYDVLGRSLDTASSAVTAGWPIHRPPPPVETLEPKVDLLETGIKVIDLLAPYVKGGQMAIFGGAGVGKTVFLLEVTRRLAEQGTDFGVFAEVGEGSYVASNLFQELKQTELISRAALVFGGADQPPEVRLRLGLAAVTMAEYIRDKERRDVLLFLDDVAQLTQTGSETSVILRQTPGPSELQPTLTDELREMQERITSTRGPSITSFQAMHVPADDISDPRPYASFANLDAVTVLRGSLSDRGIWPAVDPFDSTSRVLDAGKVGEEHYDVAQRVLNILRRYRDMEYILAVVGVDGLADEDKNIVARARKLRRFLSQPFFVSEPYTGTPGKFTPLDETIASFKALAEGEYDHLPEQAFDAIGGIEEAEERTKELEDAD